MFAYRSPNSINSLTSCIVILLSDCKGNSCARLLLVALALNPVRILRDMYFVSLVGELL